MKKQCTSIIATVSLCVILSGCSANTGPSEHYVSPHIQGESQRINLDEVQQAFFDAKGSDFNSWMAAFEKRVNEIYDGKGVVSIDATRNNNLLTVTGYIDKDQKDGFQSDDEKLFVIEQTGDAVNKEMPYRVSGYDNRPYYEGHHSFAGNAFLEGMLISHMLGGFGGRYYTPSTQVVVLRDHRDGFRQTAAYSTQQKSNSGFFSRFKSKPGDGSLQSSKTFGSDFSSSTKSKSRWFSGTSSSSSSSSWSNRRSSGGVFGGGFGSRRSWGGRRR
ncbi:MAG: hypothetical protein K2X27_10405 [Candidatus Obscuribacterales bacterium]|nr:hypothetical protein [Candidatus Obscuribacterales bacterium]